MKVEWIEQKGEKILFVDCKDVKSQDDMISIVEEYHGEVRKQSKRVKTLFDVTNATIGPGFVNRAKELGKEDAERLEKTATVGITKMKGFILRGYNLFTSNKSPITPFETKEEAIEYLVS